VEIYLSLDFSIDEDAIGLLKSSPIFDRSTSLYVGVIFHNGKTLMSDSHLGGERGTQRHHLGRHSPW